MKLQQIRNATVIINYAGTRFLVDPMLSPKGTFPAFPGTVNAHLSNPLIDLPMPMEEILDVDAVIMTHDHMDHWDDVAKEQVPKDKPLFVQNDADASKVRADGFTNVTVLGQDTRYNGISLSRTAGQHGSDDIMASPAGELLGEVCGVVFRRDEEKTVYLAGDTIWNSFVENNLKQYKPDIIILNAGDAQVEGMGSIIMGKDDVYQVHKVAPTATLIATHMEAVNHAVLKRSELRDFAIEKHFSEALLIPQDGEICTV